MKIKFNLKREVKIIAAVIVVGGIIAFTERRQSTASIKDITIKMVNLNENHFLDENDIINLMQLNRENLKGASMDRVNLKEVEKKIKSEPFIKDAQLYSDLKGNLVVKAELRRPIARLVRNDGPDGYIAEDGTVMPVSDKFTARVVLISGAYVNQLLKQNNANDTEDGQHLIALINMIRENEFWNAQIAQMDIDSKARITLFPQVGDERIEFGKPENAEIKFKKLMIFYKEILPRMGWNKYNRVNLEYEGQIVAE
ncbi:cell division protein FtsQ/DivIB [Chryseolinea lacunae]|uniref:FtsQ-type POTRA domain-containing protein n=1 Tax=Chryseolinea lacunae TaxID=2801331 RepID=A0ABS1KLN8_9BACT|nr:FtsQ-type POTRA domain-containing protein [Chryseolinea lacunae]MBL0740132.1 FtsQ-type POTRA domain-containing protein [Chryseolinea lacunae]